MLLWFITAMSANVSVTLITANIMLRMFCQWMWKHWAKARD